MRQAAGHLAPGGTALGGDQPGHVVKNHDITAPAAFRQARAAQQQHLRHAVRALQFELGLPLVFLGRRELFANEGAQYLLARPFIDRDTDHTFEIVVEDGQRALVHRAQHETAVENQHAGGQVGQDRLEIAARRLHFRPVPLGVAPRLIELAGHAVEGLGQDAQFVTAVDRLARREVALRHGLRAFGQDVERRGEAAGHQVGQRKGAEQGDEYGQGQGQRVDTGQTLARQLQLLVIAIDTLHGFGIVRQRGRHRLRQLQDARLFKHVASRYRDQHAQVELAALAFDATDRTAVARRLELRLVGQIGHQVGELAGCTRQQLAADREQGGRLDAFLFPQAQQGGTARGFLDVGQFAGHAAPLLAKVGQ